MLLLDDPALSRGLQFASVSAHEKRRHHALGERMVPAVMKPVANASPQCGEAKIISDQDGGGHFPVLTQTSCLFTDGERNAVRTSDPEQSKPRRLDRN